MVSVFKKVAAQILKSWLDKTLENPEALPLQGGNKLVHST